MYVLVDWTPENSHFFFVFNFFFGILQNITLLTIHYRTQLQYVTYNNLLRTHHEQSIVYNKLDYSRWLTFDYLHYLHNTLNLHYFMTENTHTHYALHTNTNSLHIQKVTPRLWNDLPGSIRNTQSLNKFKNAIKTFLFAKAFYFFVSNFIFLHLLSDHFFFF